MKQRSPLNFDISVSADKKRRSRLRSKSGAVESSSRECESPECKKTGKFRAPKSPDNVDEFVWFCQEHIREYNRKWNFFENHSESEFEDQLESDKVWGRDTKPFREAMNNRANVESQAFKRFGFDDPYEALGENGTLTLPPTHELARAVYHRPSVKRWIFWTPRIL